MPADTMVMLELLEEAGPEPVTLGELEVAGVRDPAKALLELELAGLRIQRVLVGGEIAPAECIRLAGGDDEQPTEELPALAPQPQPQPQSPERRLTGFVALAVLLALVALLLRRS